MSTPRPRRAWGSAARELTFGQAINEALREELRRDPTVFMIGEDVAEAGTPFKVLLGLVDEFGPSRVIDSPISEAGITGLGVGAAMTGMRPVVDIMFGDFLTLAMDQLANQAAKVHYMSGGALRVPLVLRTTLGATRRSAAAQPEPARLGQPHPRPQGRAPGDAVRRQGPAEGGHPRRQSGGLLRGQAGLCHARPRARGRVRDPARRRRRQASGQRRDDRRHEQHGLRGARGRRAARRDGHQRRGHRPAHDGLRSTPRR